MEEKTRTMFATGMPLSILTPTELARSVIRIHHTIQQERAFNWGATENLSNLRALPPVAPSSLTSSDPGIEYICERVRNPQQSRSTREINNTSENMEGNALVAQIKTECDDDNTVNEEDYDDDSEISVIYDSGPISRTEENYSPSEILAIEDSGVSHEEGLNGLNIPSYIQSTMLRDGRHSTNPLAPARQESSSVEHLASENVVVALPNSSSTIQNRQGCCETIRGQGQRNRNDNLQDGQEGSDSTSSSDASNGGSNSERSRTKTKRETTSVGSTSRPKRRRCPPAKFRDYV